MEDLIKSTFIFPFQKKKPKFQKQEEHINDIQMQFIQT